MIKFWEVFWARLPFMECSFLPLFGWLDPSFYRHSNDCSSTHQNHKDMSVIRDLIWSVCMLCCFARGGSLVWDRPDRHEARINVLRSIDRESWGIVQSSTSPCCILTNVFDCSRSLRRIPSSKTPADCCVWWIQNQKSIVLLLSVL